MAVVHGAAVAAPAGRMVRCCEVKKISRVPSARRRVDEGVRVRVGPADGRRRLLGGLRAPSRHIHTIIRPRGRLMGLGVCAPGAKDGNGCSGGHTSEQYFNDRSGQRPKASNVSRKQKITQDRHTESNRISCVCLARVFPEVLFRVA